jgi:hypothetical chaperone protein
VLVLSCGLDFGTSNSTLGVVQNGDPVLVPLDAAAPTIKSAIFFNAEDNCYVVGKKGIDQYLSGGKGRMMLSLKSILGSSLVAEKTVVCGQWLTYQEIIGLVLKHIKTTAETHLQTELTKVVLGRPVRYNDDNDSKDILAQTTMLQIAKAQGFKEVVFQFEPIAAALNYERTVQKEELALIADLGGGTSDFTVIKINGKHQSNDRKEDILANCGVHIGGTNFDRELSLHSIMPLLGKGSLMHGLNGANLEVPQAVYYDLTTWHMLNFLYTNKSINNLKQIYLCAQNRPLIKRSLDVLQKQLGHNLLSAAENAKIMLSEVEQAEIDLSIIEQDLFLKVERSDFNIYCEKLVAKLVATINLTLNSAGVAAKDINSVFLTGGTTQIPMILACMKSLLPNSLFVKGDIYGSVGKGLAIEAYNCWK